MKTVCIIPARMQSSRYYGKPIAKILGYPMIEHVYRRVQLADNIDDIYIATCDREIAEEAQKFGCKAIMTSNQHTRGTERVAEVAQSIDADIVLNVQGDEPLVEPSSLDEAVTLMKNDHNVQCINLVSTITDWNVFNDPNVVKTVKAPSGNVLYFSRQPVPHTSEAQFQEGLKQIGIYIFKRDLLLQYTQWEESPLEMAEAVDMMRFIENGIAIHAVHSADMISVDTPEELKQMEALLQEDALYKQIFGVERVH